LFSFINKTEKPGKIKDEESKNRSIVMLPAMLALKWLSPTGMGPEKFLGDIIEPELQLEEVRQRALEAVVG
jgi:hypothetical protein